MKKKIILATLCVLAFGFTAKAAVYEYMPTPGDMYDLDHDFAYTWGIDWNHTDEVIHGAFLTFTNIHDWRPESDDILYLNMLDNPASGLTQYYDNEEVGDYFAGQGTPVGTWSDPAGSFYGPGVDVTFNLGSLGLLSTLNSYAADGLFGFSLDPDCHYFNDGVKLTVVTDVPEPASIMLLGLGALGMAAYRRKRS